MDLSQLVTIVIPCKNENKTIDLTLTLLNFQKGIDKVNVIVSDSSDDETTYQLETRKNDLFNLKLIQGGLPGVARNNGSKITTTPYILFLDSDMMMLDNNILYETLNLIQKEDLDLVTLKFRTTNGKYNYVYKTFDYIQKVSKIFSPFCLGGFMLLKKETFDNLGGFDEGVKVSEDYLLSKQIKSKKFKVYNKTIFTPPRRFEKKGLWYMLKLMFLSYINRNNKKYFSGHDTYWK